MGFPFWVRRDGTGENSGVYAALETFVVPYSDDTLIFAVKYFTPSFETGQKFLALTTAEELKREPLQQLYLSDTNENKSSLESPLVSKELQPMQRSILSGEPCSWKWKSHVAYYKSSRLISLQSWPIAES